MTDKKPDPRFDAMLDMNDADFVQKLKEAIGLKDGEAVQFTSPQFHRTDGVAPAYTDVALPHLPLFSDESLIAMGCCKWDEPDNEGRTLWLYPGEWYDRIPDGTDIVDIFGARKKFKRGETDNDIRFGMLSFGFYKRDTA